MKFFKFLIFGMALVIAILIAVLGVDTENSNIIETPPSSTESATTDNQPQESGKDSAQEGGVNVEVPVLSEKERAALPPFIQAMPLKPTVDDHNGNWFRDDLELYIAYKFPYSPKSRAAFIQVAKIMERMGTDAGQTGTSRQITLWRDEQLALKCFYDSGFNDDDLAELKNLVFNSEHMRDGYHTVVEKRADIPQRLADSIVIPEDGCDPIIWENEVALQEWSPAR
ncbi:hypothetical protein DI392_01830 [Vibrio albus]|uniref:Uncharacterized protein n=1 Tax=Vibrio albus TaxID=2200953 RepID=A0A2U3BE61_9VIBR|nr:hypothetical protein [Vibrio albus]PWI35042.1 hypothetical protein DI392_01830 [Vibrio albus]